MKKDRKRNRGEKRKRGREKGENEERESAFVPSLNGAIREGRISISLPNSARGRNSK